MFDGHFKEGTEKAVKLPGKQHARFVKFLNVIYWPTNCTRDRNVLVEVLYQFDSVKKTDR